ncbi:MAG: TonB-dependent receptor, partial [Enhydrobacter sp.]|nr:TonB-dependent receptor [Enhydrobacter sp.]
MTVSRLGRGSWPYKVAAGLLLTAAMLGDVPGATAQDRAAEIAQADRTFDIPPQTLAGALAAFGQQSGMQVSVDAGLAQGIASPGASGTMSASQALERQLAGTGITYRITGNTAMLQRVGQPGTSGGAMQLDPVNVQGAFPVPSQAMIDNLPPAYAGGQVATGGQLGLLGNRGVMDTPFNQTSYTAKKAQDQQAKTVRDVLIDDPSVRAWAAQGSIGIDNLRIRGFDGASGASVAYGGLFGMTPIYSVMPEMAERIEVLKGPSALLNGMQPTGAIGGYINIVPKRAPSEPLTQVTADYVSDAQFGGHVDVARRFGADSQFGARFNGVFRAGQTPVQYNSDQRALAVLGLDYRGESVRLSADLGFQ